jgi:hypothetical protein
VLGTVGIDETLEAGFDAGYTDELAFDAAEAREAVDGASVCDRLLRSEKLRRDGGVPRRESAVAGAGVWTGGAAAARDGSGDAVAAAAADDDDDDDEWCRRRSSEPRRRSMKLGRRSIGLCRRRESAAAAAAAVACRSAEPRRDGRASAGAAPLPAEPRRKSIETRARGLLSRGKGRVTGARGCRRGQSSGSAVGWWALGGVAVFFFRPSLVEAARGGEGE